MGDEQKSAKKLFPSYEFYANSLECFFIKIFIQVITISIINALICWLSVLSNEFKILKFFSLLMIELFGVVHSLL